MYEYITYIYDYMYVYTHIHVYIYTYTFDLLLSAYSDPGIDRISLILRIMIYMAFSKDRVYTLDSHRFPY